MFKNKGFSLIELLLVVAVAAGIFVFSAPFGMNFYRTQLLGDVQSNLIDALQRARHNAVLQKNDSNFGVKLSDINNNYVLFQTPDLTYSNRVQSQDEVFTVARGITLTTGLSDVIFSKMTGLPNATGTINIFYNSDLYRGILVDNNAVLSKIDATSSAPVVVGSNETTVPDAPTIGIATAGNTTATVTFTAPAFSGGTAITGYTVTSNPAGGIDTNAGSTGLSHSITGLTNSAVYTFTVTATNNVGTSLSSGPSNSVTPLPTDVYWVGGTGNWSDSANHWASTSGGMANANNLPGVTTNVTFDTNSGTGIVTVNGNASMATFTHSKAGLTVAIGTYNLAVTGASSLTNGTTTIGISAGTGWTTAGMTIGTGGTVTATGASIITASGNWNSSAGTFNYGASTVNLTGTGSVTTVGWAAIAFYKLSVAYTGYTTTFSTSNMSVKQIIVNGGTLTGAGAVLRLDPTLSTTGLVSNNSSSTINLSLDYNPTTANTTYYIGADAVMTGTSISLSCNPDNVNFELNRNLSIRYLTIENHGSGTTFSTGANSYSLTLSNDFTDTHYGYVPNNTSFSVYFNNSSVTIGGNLTPMQYAGIAAYNKTDYFYFGGANISIKGNYTTYYTYGGNTYSWVINPGTSTVNFTKTSGTQTVTSFNGTSTQPFYNLTKSGAGTLTLADNLVASGNILHTAGTLNAGGKNITTTGNLTISDGALVTASGLAGSTVTAGGNFSASGHAGALLTLNPASAWYLKVAGTAVANYVNVAYSNASGGTAITQTNSTNGGNNTNWGF